MSSEYLNNKVFESVIANFQKAKRDLSKYEMIIEDLEGATKRKAIRNADAKWDLKMLNRARSFYGQCQRDHNETQRQLATAFYTLSENIVRYARFNLIDEDDAVQEGVMICFEKIDRFDPRKGKAFNYMTTCILNHFRQLYRTARNYNEFKKRYHDYLQNKVLNTFVKNGREVSAYSTTNLRRPF